MHDSQTYSEKNTFLKYVQITDGMQTLEKDNRKKNIKKKINNRKRKNNL
jgi:hypothetical protein